jgi:hypothetical protein
MGVFNSNTKEWDETKKGLSGTFKTKSNIAIKYIQTTFKAKELDLIKPLRSVFKAKDLDNFDLLMQRDLDDNRIITDLIPYLQRTDKLSFFPPLLVVVLNVQIDSNRKTSQKKYPKLEENIITNPEDSSGTSKLKSQKYGNLFSVDTLFVNDKEEKWFTLFNFNRDTTLLAIDGQHRLVALQAITNKLTSTSDSEKFSNFLNDASSYDELEVPVTILYVPDMHEGAVDTEGEPLTNIFRQVFVDVNKFAKPVSKMRNILLDENDINAIFTRKICSEVLLNKHQITINEIEWNKEHKVDQLTEDLSITSIVFIKNFLDSWLGDYDSDGGNLKQNLNLSSLMTSLNEDDFFYENITNSRYSYQQKNIILTHFETKYLEGVINFIQSLPLFGERNQIIKNIKSELDRKIETGTDANAVTLSKYLFDGTENKTLITREVKPFLIQVLTELTKFEQENKYDLIKTQMFQLAYYELLLDLYAISSEDDFNSFCEKFKLIVQKAQFRTTWKEIFVDKYDVFKSGIGGIGKSKQTLVNSYLKLFINNNLNTFENEGLILTAFEIDISDIKKQFIYNKRKELDKLDLDDDEIFIETQLKKYEEDLAKIYIIENSVV